MSQPPPARPPYGSAGESGEVNRLAIASLVLGLLWLYGLGTVAALVLGYSARRQIRETGQRGEGLAVAGIVFGWLGVAVVVLVVGAVLVARFT